MDQRNNLVLQRIFSIFKLILLLIIIIGIPSYIFFVRGDSLSYLRNIDSIKDITDFLQQYKTEGIFIYLGIQILQIIISVIPGQIFQMAAGYLYGFVFGLFLSCIGATIGSSIAYSLAYFLGHKSIKIFAKEETVNKLAERLNSKRAYTMVFLLYLIPGFPKDMVAYAAGISHMSIKAFLLLSLIGRIPAMSASLLVGAFYESGSYVGVGIVAVITAIVFVVSIIKRDSISKKLDSLYEKVSS